MKVREWLNNNSAVVTILAVVVLVISLGVIIMNSTGTQADRVVDMYYYDVNTGKLFIGQSDQIPPIEAPSGPGNGVQAFVFACGECPTGLEGATLAELEAAGAFIGWLEKYTDEAKRALSGEATTPEEEMASYEAYEQGQLIRTPDNDQWVSATGEEGYQLMEQISTRCPGDQMAQPCYPNR